MTFCFIVLFNDEQTNNLHSKLTFISSQLSHYENVEKSLTMKQIFFLPHLICKTKGNPIKKKKRERLQRLQLICVVLISIYSHSIAFHY